MEKVLQELFWMQFFGCPYHSSSIKIYLDLALHMIKLKNLLHFKTQICTYISLHKVVFWVLF